LQFRFSTGNSGEELAGSMRLSGLAEYADTEFPLAPTSSLEGWQLNWRDEADPAAGIADKAATLEELRSGIRASD